jgi:hypothetical protein
MSRILGLLALTACLLATGCFQDSTAQHSAFLPLSYPSTFQVVRTCRLSVALSNQYLRVLADTFFAADPYTSGTYPLPAGSVVVAEEHGSDSSCNSLMGYNLMAKEKPGYNSAVGDWHWQELDANQRIIQDGKLTTCSSCHAQPPCNSDFLCSPP